MAKVGIGGAMSRGMGALSERVQGSGIMKWGKKLTTGFGYLSNHVKNIALFDPEGFGVVKTVRVPMVMSQVVDHRQPCEFLPSECFKKGRQMRVERGQLFSNGMGFPIEPIADAGLERAVTYDNKQLYAINTSNTKEVFKALGLNEKKFKNKRLVIACDGVTVVPTPIGKDRRLMRAVYNAEVSPETRRIKNEVTGSTMWIPTILVAMPINLITGMSNVVMMVPHALFNGAAKLVDRGASALEEKYKHVSVAKSRGTIVGGYSFVAHYAVMGFILRSVERILSSASCCIGGLRSVSVAVLRSVPLFVNAGCNTSRAQFAVGQRYLSETFSGIWDVAKRFVSDTKDSLQVYSGVDTGVNRETDIDVNAYDAVVDNTRESARERQKTTSPGVENVVDRNLGVNREHKGLPATLSLCEADMLCVKKVGHDLSELGVTVGYGTADQVRDNFVGSASVKVGQLGSSR
ncbi:hypothetical protein [Candidatus Anaplasma sp. TIGMIC]|uniref:hypothetical protein n=1 Tax=Candidatus Anaplasma sp. TIGMIC TaxID=3020713 RepID=UPI00232F2DA3|nr:hypothetical protein [Candidatus Anaplasma sp. TIGMIC]MDB1135030.1 hypothetical protein [Candidatus Anaplasma sp. TIGMIC]